MKYVEMKKVLNELNKEWELDFVSATSGNCCNTCGEMMTARATEAWESAETYLVVKWYFKGMNYWGKFEEQTNLYVKYNLGSVPMDKVVADLSEALSGKYRVVAPKASTQCIELVKL